MEGRSSFLPALLDRLAWYKSFTSLSDIEASAAAAWQLKVVLNSCNAVVPCLMAYSLRTCPIVSPWK